MYPAYLVAFIYWTGISVGCLLLTMLHYLVGGNWGYSLKRPLEAGALVIMPMALLFIPLVLGMKSLYPWTDVAHLDEILAAQAGVSESWWFHRPRRDLLRDLVDPGNPAEPLGLRAGPDQRPLPSPIALSRCQRPD